MKLKPAISTISNAMDVANPSNFVRILEIYDRDYLNIKEEVESISVSDETTAETMREVYEKYAYILDPHGAVGFYALSEYLKDNPHQKGIFLETAHPVKFDSVEKITGTYGKMPKSVEALFSKSKQNTKIEVNYENLQTILEELI